ncbi:MAG: phosphate signaling complex protein PhoU [Deferrisomatales bacterium]
MWKELIKIWKSQSLLDQAWNESFEMLEIDQRMFREAVRILRESDDLEIASDVRELDRRVNKYERDVRRKVLTHCAVAGGSADLPSAMVLVSVVIDIERIGDYCKNIVELAQHHPQRLSTGPFEAELDEVEGEVKERFERTIEVLRHHDVEGARELMATYRPEVSAVCDRIVDDLLEGKTNELTASDAAALALYARYLKRISAHLKNVASSVVNPFPRIGFKEKQPRSAS